VAGSGRRGGVLVGGHLRWGGDVLGAVLWLEAEAREVVVGAASEGDKNTAWGEKNPSRRQAATPFYRGGRWDARGGGSEEPGDTWGEVGEREGGGGSGAAWDSAVARRRGAGRQRDAALTRDPVVQCARFGFQTE
jgi:hypothetical protein